MDKFSFILGFVFGIFISPIVMILLVEIMKYKIIREGED